MLVGLKTYRTLNFFVDSLERDCIILTGNTMLDPCYDSYEN
jgi:hypothetical protein